MKHDPHRFKVTFQPTGRRVELNAGETILSGAQQIDAGLLATCGGQGTCQDCKIRILSGTFNELSVGEKRSLSPQEIKEGYRLACQTYPHSDGIVDIPPESLSVRQRLQIENQSTPLLLDLPTRWHLIKSDMEISPEGWDAVITEFCVESGLELTPAILQQVRSDFKRMKPGITGIKLIYQEKAFIGCLPGDKSPLGLAVDMGTTKLAAYLIRLEDGKVIASDACMNPQLAFGEDVVSRISYANNSPEHEEKLRCLLMDAINQLCSDLCANVQSQTGQVVDAVLVGNTVIHHFCAGLPVSTLGEAPYQPVQSAAMNLPAVKIGLKIHPGARVYLPPNIAGYVGADHVAMLLASGAYPPADKVLALDIGTNTEISLSVGGKLYSCSCASGPAFEGARIHEGMRASAGAIEKVRLIDGQIRIHTVDDQPAVGICGSGILDAISVMLTDGAIDARGSIQKQHPRVIDFDGQKVYPLIDTTSPRQTSPAHIYRKDVNEIQLAKAAIRTGCDLLLQHAVIQAEDLDQIILAGAFGTYLSIDSAIQIGMLPHIPNDRIVQIGNAAGKGAQMLLCSASTRQKAAEIASTVNYVELATQPDFMRHFTENLSF